MIAAAKGAGMVVVRRVREAIKPRSALGGLIADLTRTREELESENAALRQQVILLSRGVKKPKIKTVDRVVLVLASASTATWRSDVSRHSRQSPFNCAPVKITHLFDTVSYAATSSSHRDFDSVEDCADVGHVSHERVLFVRTRSSRARALPSASCSTMASPVPK